MSLLSQPPEDVTESFHPSGAWASGAVVSTPFDLNAFMRAYLRLRFFRAAEEQEQMRFVRGGRSSPPGPGGTRRPGAVPVPDAVRHGVQPHRELPRLHGFAAATADGERGVTTTLNIPAPTGRLLARLRALQAKAVCALLR